MEPALIMSIVSTAGTVITVLGVSILSVFVCKISKRLSSVQENNETGISIENETHRTQDKDRTEETRKQTIKISSSAHNSELIQSSVSQNGTENKVLENFSNKPIGGNSPIASLFGGGNHHLPTPINTGHPNFEEVNTPPTPTNNGRFTHSNTRVFDHSAHNSPHSSNSPVRSSTPTTTMNVYYSPNSPSDESSTLLPSGDHQYQVYEVVETRTLINEVPSTNISDQEENKTTITQSNAIQRVFNSDVTSSLVSEVTSSLMNFATSQILGETDTLGGENNV